MLNARVRRFAPSQGNSPFQGTANQSAIKPQFIQASSRPMQHTHPSSAKLAFKQHPNAADEHRTSLAHKKTNYFVANG
jgi:hypothetical protein